MTDSPTSTEISEAVAALDRARDDAVWEARGGPEFTTLANQAIHERAYCSCARPSDGVCLYCLAQTALAKYQAATGGG